MNNGVSFIEKYNALFGQIRNAKSVEDMRQLFADMKEFFVMYVNVDTDAVNRIFESYSDKLQEMLNENDIIYNRLSERAETIGNKEYDFTDEKDNTQAVQNKVLQLMAQLPKEKTSANTGTIVNVIEKTITSGIVGCKAVLELMKYPTYLEMISESLKHKAFIGSKSECQQIFEREKEKELREVEKKRADVYMKGFHLRNLEKQVKNFKKSSVWA